MDKKLWYIYTMEYNVAIKKEGILPFATAWMDLESIVLRKIYHSEKYKYHMISYDFTHMRNLINEVMSKIETGS